MEEREKREREKSVTVTENLIGHLSTGTIMRFIQGDIIMIKT